MLQKKEYQQQQKQKECYKTRNTNKKTNATKEGLPTTTTKIKKSIVENQTSGKIKTNVTKEGLPTTTKKVTPTKTNATKQGIPTTNNKECYKKEIPTIKNVQNKDYQ